MASSTTSLAGTASATATGSGSGSGSSSARTSDSLRMSIRQPVSFAARRAF